MVKHGFIEPTQWLDFTLSNKTTGLSLLHQGTFNDESSKPLAHLSVSCVTYIDYQSFITPENCFLQQTRWDSLLKMHWCLPLSFQCLTLERIKATVIFGPIYLHNCLLTELKVLRLTVYPLSLLLQCFSQSSCFHTFVSQVPYIKPFPFSLSISLPAFPPIISGVMAASQHSALTWALGSGGWLGSSRRWQSSAQLWTQSSKRWWRRWETVGDTRPE